MRYHASSIVDVMLQKRVKVDVHWTPAETPKIISLSSLSGKTSYHQRDVGLDFYNHSEIWQAPRQQRFRDACQNSERIIITPISRLRDFTNFGGKTSYRLLNRGQGS